MHQHNVRKKQLIDQRIDTIKDAVALTDDDGVILPNRLMAESIAQQIKSLLGSIETMDKEIRRLYKSMDDRAIFDSLPGAGPQMAPVYWWHLAAIETVTATHLKCNGMAVLRL